MYKTILVPIDMGHLERAKPMIDAARQLGPDAKLVLVHAIESIPAYIEIEIPRDYLEQTKESALESLNKLAAEVKGNVEVKLVEGHAASAILALAKEEGADAIVIASHKPGWQDYLIGSTASRVVSHAKCTVLVVR